MEQFILVREPERDETVREIKIIQPTVIGQKTIDRLLSKGWERVGWIEAVDGVSLEGLRRGLSAASTRKAQKAYELFQQIAGLAETGEQKTSL